ncbi:MAG: HlyD family secretion protein [Proteobacteria bacterium]|nr:HlyD family secretion protein [Pseudomonadota bacterium]
MADRLKYLFSTILLVLFFAGGYLAYERWGSVEPLPEGLIQVNGRIEGDHVTVASKYPGRVHEILAREGDTVEQGQILIRLEDAETRARVAQARHGVTALGAQLRAASTTLGVLRKEVPLGVKEAEQRIEQARARRAEAEAAELQARRDAERYRNLAERGTVPRRVEEQTETAWIQAREQLYAAISARTLAEHQLDHARLGGERIKAMEDEVAALAAQLEQARAALEESQAVLDNLTITAPTSGMITTRIVDIGGVIGAGSPLYDIVDLDRLYLKAYMPGVEIGKLRRGLIAQIYTDAFPEQPFAATVRYIASRAEFTPKEVQTPDERVKQVYAVKLYLDENPEHRLTPGMPADAVIRWKEGTPWAKPRW